VKASPYIVWRTIMFRLTVVGVVLLIHLGVLIWLQAHSFLPTPTDNKVPLPILSGYLIVPAPPPEVRQPLTMTNQANIAAQATVLAKRTRTNSVSTTDKLVHPATPKPVSESEPIPSNPDTGTSSSETNVGNGAAVSISPQSGGNSANLALPPRFNSSPGIAHRAQQQLDLERSSPAVVSTGVVAVTERRFSDGTTRARVTTPLGSYCLSTPAMPSRGFSDLPMYRSVVPSACP
jgi:hypothetical protein